MDGREHVPPFGRRFAAEFVGTFVLTLVAAGADVLDAITSGSIGHAARYLAPSMNPARSLGPAIATATYADWWVYLIGPLGGAIVAVAVIFAVYGTPTHDESEAAHGKGHAP